MTDLLSLFVMAFFVGGIALYLQIAREAPPFCNPRMDWGALGAVLLLFGLPAGLWVLGWLWSYHTFGYPGLAVYFILLSPMYLIFLIWLYNRPSKSK